MIKSVIKNSPQVILIIFHPSGPPLRGLGARRASEIDGHSHARQETRNIWHSSQRHERTIQEMITRVRRRGIYSIQDWSLERASILLN